MGLGIAVIIRNVDDLRQIAQGSMGDDQGHAGPLAGWETDRYAMKRKLGYRLYLVDYEEGRRKGRSGEKRESKTGSIEERWTERDHPGEREEDLWWGEEKGGLIVGKAYFLKGQVT